MAALKVEYGASSALTITLASLATSSSLLVGRESDAVDNTTNKYLDYEVGGRITTGTSPTAGYVEVWAVGLVADAPVWPAVFDGTDSAETLVSDAVKFAACRPIALIATDTTNDRNYDFGPTSIASLFGGVCPPKFVVFVTHSSGVNLNATGGNHYIHIRPIHFTVA